MITLAMLGLLVGIVVLSVWSMSRVMGAYDRRSAPDRTDRSAGSESS